MMTKNMELWDKWHAAMIWTLRDHARVRPSGTLCLMPMLFLEYRRSTGLIPIDLSLHSICHLRAWCSAHPEIENEPNDLLFK